MSSRSAPLGLLGGTFDPVHRAHLALAHAAMAELGLDGVRWIPSGQPGHRAQPGATAAQRLEMLALALADQPRFSLDSTDALAAGSTWTINTLARLRHELGAEKPLVFIIGADQLLALDTWRDWRRLFDSAHFAVAERPGYVLDRSRLSDELAAELAARMSVSIDGQPAGRILRFAMPPHDLSASSIRAALARDETPENALPGPVIDYIRTHHLYRNTGF